MSVANLTQGVIIATRNKILILSITILLCSACYPTPTPGPTCNPAVTFWPTDIEGPPEWGTPCESSWLEVPILMHKSIGFVTSSAYAVYGRVTVYDAPLEGAEIHVNRIVGGEHSGAGMVLSDANGDYRLGVSGFADALRIWIVYPPQYEPWGVQAPVIAWNLTTIHWESPPVSCGPILWWAATKHTPPSSRTPTITRTPTRTLTPSLTPTATETPIHTPTMTGTAIVIPSLPPNPPMPDTMLGVAQESLRSQWRMERVVYLLAVAALGMIAKIAKMTNDQSKGG